jgi:ribosome biogenesis GTPase
LNKKGIVTKSTGSWYNVLTEEKQNYQCRIVGKFRLADSKITNPVAVGDRVKITIENEDDKVGNIVHIENRENYVVRQSPRKKHQLHILASNIDQAILVTTIKSPKLKQGFIDRFLMMTEPYNIPVIIVFNKKDIYEEKDMEMFEILNEIYSEIGYTCILVSGITKDGIDVLKSCMSGKISLIAGQSGVGKSTLVNAVDLNLELKTDDISEYTGKGQHTTTFAEMHHLDDNTAIIDTPGIKTLSFSHFEPMDVAHNFKEIFEVSSNCKYHDCLHRGEPKCAVLDALEEGIISEMRYGNYLMIIDEIEDQNYWERHTHM